MAATNDLRRVNTDYSFQAQFVNVEGRAVAVHQHHRRREIKTATRQDPEKGDTIKSIFRSRKAAINASYASGNIK